MKTELAKLSVEEFTALLLSAKYSRVGEILSLATDTSIKIDKVDIYDYLEHRTNNFCIPSVEIVKSEMEQAFKNFWDAIEFEGETESIADSYNKSLWYFEEHEAMSFPHKTKEEVDVDVQRYYHFALDILNKALVNADREEQPQPGPEADPQPEAGGLPERLNTPEANKYWQRAKDLGLIDDDYRWQQGLQLLSCFCYEMSRHLKLGKGERVNWQIFAPVFDVRPERLRGNYNDIQKTGQQPHGFDVIDKVFE